MDDVMHMGEALTAYAEPGDYPAVPDARPSPPTDAELARLFAPSDDVIGLSATGELEPAFVDAFEAAIDTLWSSSAAVKQAALRLRLQGDPKGLMSGDGSTDEERETNAPTPHRVAGKGDAFEVIATSHATGRDRSSEAWRAVPVLEQMRRRNQIDDTEKTAGERFYWDFVLGHRQGGLVARYGDMGNGSTPAGQQQTRYVVDGNGEMVEAMSPEDRRQHHHTMWVRACDAIGTRRCPVTNNKQPGATLAWMMKLVCEDYLLAETKAPTLEDAGRAYLGCKSPVQASAAGAALVKGGLERLVLHYGLPRE